MAVKFSVLVIANRTADSPELVEALRARAEQGPARFTVLAPASIGREVTEARLEAGLERMRASGLEVEGRIGDPDPISAVHDTWDPAEFDEVIVSTLPAHASKWLTIGLPQRVARLTDAMVTQVVASEPSGEPPTVADTREKE